MWLLSRPRRALLGLVAAFLEAVGGEVATPSLILLAENGQPSEVVGLVNLVGFFVTPAETIAFAHLALDKER